MSPVMCASGREGVHHLQHRMKMHQIRLTYPGSNVCLEAEDLGAMPADREGGSGTLRYTSIKSDVFAEFGCGFVLLLYLCLFSMLMLCFVHEEMHDVRSRACARTAPATSMSRDAMTGDAEKQGQIEAAKLCAAVKEKEKGSVGARNPERRSKGIAGIDTRSTWWKRELRKRNLVEVYEPGRGRRNCGLYRLIDNEEPRPVSPECEDRRWWKMNQPRRGPDFRVDPTTHDFFQFLGAAGEELGSGEKGRSDKGRCRSNRQEQCANTNTGRRHLPFLLQEGGKRKGKVSELLPELCDFRVDDQVLAAADGAWYMSTVLKVEEKRCLVKIGDDNKRLIEFTPREWLPAKPEDGHRLLNCTVHLDKLPYPWIGMFVIDVTRESGKTYKGRTPNGDWIFRREHCGEEEDDDDDRRIKRIEKRAKPSEKDLAFLYCCNAVASGRGGASCGSGAQKKAVDDTVKRAMESAEKMYPFVTGCADYCPDIAVPANIEERYGGESCFRCGDVGLLCLCSECRDKGAVCETVVCFECLDRPADRHKYDPALGGEADWFCAKCTTARFNRDRERTSVVKKDEHVLFVLEQFHVEDQDPLSALQPPGMHEVPFKMAEIENMPNDFAIGLIVGPSGTGKTLMLRSGFGYDESLWNSKWDDDLAIISQVHQDPEEALARLMAVGISSEPDMCRPFKDLSTGQQDCARMARALGHGAVFDEFGSTLGPLGVLKLCMGMRRFVQERGLGNLVVATCNTQIARILKPDWVITTGLGSSKVKFRLYEPGYWGPDEKHRVEGALDAVSSRLLAGRAGQWSEEEVENLKTRYRLFEQETERAESAAEKVKAAERATMRAALEEDAARLGKLLADEYNKQIAPCGQNAAASSQEDQDDQLVLVESRSESWDKDHVRGSAESLNERLRATQIPAMTRGAEGSPVMMANKETVKEELRRSVKRVVEYQMQLKRIQEQMRSPKVGAGAGFKGGVVLDLNAMLDHQFMPQPLASSLRIQIQSSERSVWTLFKVAHYKGSQELSTAAHVFIATLPDHGNGLSPPLSLTTHTNALSLSRPRQCIPFET
jgi:hypothetical protein